MASLLRFEHITRRFGPLTAVDNLNLEVEQGEVFSLLGPSGCGKTTLLRLAAGFERPDAGRILLDGRDITHLEPNQRPLNTVFQNYALFPHLSVRDNIAFGPKIAGWTAGQIAREVERMLELIDLKDHADGRPHELSGGMKQRVAIARALINKPKVLLLDEPLAALDLKLRQRLLIELDAIHDEVGITFIYVTHDQGEAMSISDRIGVMNHGVIEQIGTPASVYETPRTSFVAAFIGDTNFLEGRVTRAIDSRLSLCAVDDLGDIIIRHDRALIADERVDLSLRPEKLVVSKLRPDAAADENLVAAVVEEVIYFGSHTRCWLRCGRHRLCVDIQHGRLRPDESPPAHGSEVWLRWHAGDAFLLDRYRSEDEQMLTLPAVCD